MSENEPKEKRLQVAASSAENPSLGPTVDALFAEHHGRVFQAAYRVTGNATDAEDVLQTVFLRLLRGPGQLDPDRDPGAYLRRSAVNAAIDLMRSGQRRRSVPLELVRPEALSPADPDPERRVADRELKQQLRDAVGRLSPRAAEMFALKYFEGLGNREIAEMVGASPSVVAVTLFRARHQVKRDLRTGRKTQS